MVVVVQAGFGVGVLAGEPQGRRGSAGSPGGRAPQGVQLVAGQVPAGTDELGWSADQDGDERVEPLVDFGLRGVAEPGAFGLGQRSEGTRLIVPGGDPRRRTRTLAGLLDQDGAVPGEGRGLEEGGAVLGVVLLGNAAAERVVAVPPVMTVWSSSCRCCDVSDVDGFQAEKIEP